MKYLGFAAVVICLGLTADLGAQKGGKPKAVDKVAIGTFRCNGPTAATHDPVGAACGPFAEWGVRDAITGDGNPYIGAGTTVGGSGAFLRSDGELELIWISLRVRKLSGSDNLYRRRVSRCRAGALRDCRVVAGQSRRLTMCV